MIGFPIRQFKEIFPKELRKVDKATMQLNALSLSDPRFRI